MELTSMPAEEQPGKSATVVIIDDRMTLLTLLTMILEDEGYHCVCCQEARQAIPTILAHRPELIILDLKLDDGSGEQILEALVLLGEAIPVIIYSATVSETTAVENRRIHGDFPFVRDVLQKPFALDTLLDRISEVLS